MKAIIAERLDLRTLQTDFDLPHPPLPSLYQHVVGRTTDCLQKTLSYLEGVREEGTTEPVHQMRVWARRSLSALSLCIACFGSEGFTRIQREVKAAIDALAEACDLDMIQETLSERAETLAPLQRPGMEALLAYLRQQRQALQGPLLRAARRLERQDLLRHFEAVAAKRASSESGRVRHGKRRWMQGREEPISLLGHAARIIGARLEAVLDLEGCLFCPEQVEELHRMRLAVKRLRYTMELFEEIYDSSSGAGKEFRAALAQIQTLQNSLGQIHDADVLVPRLITFVASRLEDGPYKGRDAGSGTGAAPLPIEDALVLLTLCQEMRRGRSRDYGQFLETWRELRREKFFDRLLGLLQATTLCHHSEAWE